MKKFIGIIGVIGIVLVMFFSTSDAQSLLNTDLASLISLNSADAECAVVDTNDGGRCNFAGRCNLDIYIRNQCIL